MSKKSYMEIFDEAQEKADNMTCPECECEGTLEYADDEVLVCKNCDFSIEAEDLHSYWIDKLEEEEGFYD